MGICLDTEANVSTQEDGTEVWKGGGGRDGLRRGSRPLTSDSGQFPMQNGRVKFDPPNVPVIFVLGGPGSGKVTHCDTLMQEKRGVTHINMMDLLQQYAIGNDMQDFSQLSSRTVTEVLMLEMKMAPAAKAYLVSGFPRSMRDVVEYQEKIGVINGVLLISWRQAVLQKQIDYGAKLGHVVLSLAKMELENFFKNVMPVADYFDQSDLLLAVNGERSPSEVYKDFRAAVLDILSAQENQEAEMNGVAGMGKGSDDIPGSIVSVDTAPSPQRVVTQQPRPLVGVSNRVTTQATVDPFGEVQSEKPQTEVLNKHDLITSSNGAIPPVIFVIGGPGSNKASLCLKVVGGTSGWTHFSVGRILRSQVEADAKPNSESYLIKEAIMEGDFVNQSLVENLLEAQLNYWRGRKGVIIDGYPRSAEQLKKFEEKFEQKPHIVLLDCSKLQLGRGRLDDTVSSFRRRLELFREQTLPMLKKMDGEGRLTIVDGDTDSPAVQREFEKVVGENILKLAQGSSTQGVPTGSLYDRRGGGPKTQLKRVEQELEEQDAIVHDLEQEESLVNPAKRSVATISQHVSLGNGHLKRNAVTLNGFGPPGQQQQQMNGHIPNGKPNFRNMLEEADNYPIHSYM